MLDKSCKVIERHLLSRERNSAEDEEIQKMKKRISRRLVVRGKYHTV